MSEQDAAKQRARALRLKQHRILYREKYGEHVDGCVICAPFYGRKKGER